MTQKEFLKAVLRVEGLPDAVAEYAETSLEKIENKPADKKVLENQALKEQIVGAIGEEKLFAGQVADKVGITRQRASALLAILFKEERVKRGAVKDGKTLKYQYYL